MLVNRGLKDAVGIGYGSKVILMRALQIESRACHPLVDILGGLNGLIMQTLLIFLGTGGRVFALMEHWLMKRLILATVALRPMK